MSTEPATIEHRDVQAPLAIVGMACLFPKADGLEMYWANIKRGVDGIGPVPASHWSPEDYFDADPKAPDHTYARRGGFLEPVPFDPAAYGIAPNALEATDAAQLLGLVVASEALKSAGYGHDRAWDRSRTSVVLGVTGTLQLVIPLGARLGHPHWRKALAEAGVPAEVAEDVVGRIAEAYVPWQEASFPGLLGNVVAGRIANRLDLGGTNCVVDAACASSLSAVHLAALELTAGRAEMVVTGGVDAFNDIFMYMCFSKTPALSPSGDARPFDAEGDGTILGEGVGMVVLKRLEDAERDGDTIWAVLKGVGTASDGRGKAIYAPDDDGQRRALQAAYAAAGVTPATIELVEGHGTGTKVGDAIELAALRQVYGEARPGGAWCALGSVKSQIGHTKAAAGAAGLIKAALALHHKVLPPTIKVARPQASLVEPASPFYLTTAPRPWLRRAEHPRRAAVSSFGFGGSNFHAVLEEHSPTRRAPDWDGLVELVAIGAASHEALSERLSRYSGEMGWEALRIAAQDDRAAFDPAAAHRLAFVVERGADLAGLLAGLRSRLADGRPFQTPEGAHYGVGEPEGSLAAIFPGQGSQYPGMGRELACVFPAALDALEAAEAAFAGGEGMERPHGERLVDRMIPPSAFDETTRSAQADALRATDVAQPALGATELGAWRVLEALGVEPAAAAGHSYGELAALCAAGRLADADFLALSVLRGRLMAAGQGKPGDESGTGQRDLGGMLAVAAGVTEVAAAIAEVAPELVIANKNAPTQVVVAGPGEAIARAEAAFAARGLRAVRLPVGAAFHSPLVAGAETAFAQALSCVAMPEGRFPVWANTTAAPYPPDEAAARALLAGQLARPVEWVSEVESLYAAGVRTFLEVGPGARLCGLVKAVLGERPHLAVAVDASAGKRAGLGDLARALAALAARGHAVRLAAWQGGEEAVAPLRSRKPAKMAVPISGANHRTPRPARPPRQPMAAAAPQAPVVPPMATPASPPATPAPARPVVQAPATPAAPAASPVVVSEAVRAASETLAAWQKMQEQTAQLHKAFLDGQQAAQETFGRLIEHQRALLGHLDGRAPAPAAMSVVAQPPVAPALPVAAPAPVAAAAPPAPTPAAAPAAPPVAVRMVPAAAPAALPALLAVVAEKTGYPIETLSPEMALEADLGIDSIKRVEILSALAERLPGAAPIAPDRAGTLVTLADVAAAMGSAVPAASPPDPAPATQAPQLGQANAPARGATDAVAAAVIAVVAEKTGYPAETLDLEMALEADLGIDSIKRVEIMSALAERLPGAPTVAPDRLGAASTLRAVAELLGAGAAPAEPADAAIEALLAVVAEKTGYPIETLELGMALEADLGIDSIKRVEILSALAERLPGAAPIAPDRAGTLVTLADVAAAMGGALRPASPPDQSQAVRAPQPEQAHEPVTAGEDAIAAAVVHVVAEKTGYPAETLELGMALEADLGIDSIKRVEILSTLAERLPGAPRLAPDALGALATMADLAAALGGGRAAPPAPVASVPPAPVASVSPAPVASVPAAPVASVPAAPVASAPAVPAPEAALIVEALVPVALGEGQLRPSPKAPFGTELWVAGPPGCSLTAAVADRFGVLGYRAVRLEVTPNAAWPEPSGLCGLVLVGAAGAGPLWSVDDELALKAAFRLVAHAGPGLRAAASRGGAWLATVTRLDGALGFAADAVAGAPAQGALAGLAKTAALEWPELPCQALDIHPGWDDAEAAAAIAAELFLDGPVEIGLGPAGRVGLQLVPAGTAPAAEAPFAPGDLVVVSGGARGVTAEVAVALARAWRPTLALLGRTALPADEPAWLAGIADEAEAKRAIVANEGALAPRELEARWRELAAAREVRATLARLEALGAGVRYVAVDVRDPAAVATAIAELRAAHGPVRGLIHGAGVLADKYILDKTAAQFDAVFDTKIGGLRALLGALGEDEARAIVLFSSVTARRGRVGQSDYAMANELLNKAARGLAQARPGCRVLAVDWGPWDGGMVTPALKRLFAAEGVGVVPLEAGAAWLVDELARSRPGTHELVVLGAPPGAPAAPAPATPAVATAAPVLRTAFRQQLAVRSHPFLASHVMNGKPVLPVAMTVEWMAHAALHANPGMAFRGLADFAVLKGVVIEQEPCAVRLDAAVATGAEGEALVELRSDERELVHARARVLLGATPGVPPAAHWSAGWTGGEGAAPYARGVAEAYREVLFHGAEFRGIMAVDALGPEGVVGRVRAARPPAAWLQAPLRDAWIVDPLALDAAFQLLILWSVESLAAPCLPCRASGYRQYAGWPAEGVQVAARVVARKAGVAIADVAFLDGEGRLVAELQGAECAFDPGLAEAFRRNALAAPLAP